MGLMRCLWLLINWETVATDCKVSNKVLCHRYGARSLSTKQSIKRTELIKWTSLLVVRPRRACVCIYMTPACPERYNSKDIANYFSVFMQLSLCIDQWAFWQPGLQYRTPEIQTCLCSLSSLEALCSIDVIDTFNTTVVGVLLLSSFSLLSWDITCLI